MPRARASRRVNSSHTRLARSSRPKHPHSQSAPESRKRGASGAPSGAPLSPTVSQNDLVDYTIFHACPHVGCKYRAKVKSAIKQHRADVHDIGVVWHPCPMPDCGHMSKRESHIKQHLANVHDIGVTWYRCTEPDCKVTMKDKSALNQHKAAVHDVGVRWSYCDVEGCKHRAKTMSDITRHKANKHSIDVKWKKCPHCDYKAKVNFCIKSHMKNMHKDKL